jgi:hypothetical protein
MVIPPSWPSGKVLGNLLLVEEAVVATAHELDQSIRGVDDEDQLSVCGWKRVVKSALCYCSLSNVSALIDILDIVTGLRKMLRNTFTLNAGLRNSALV